MGESSILLVQHLRQISAFLEGHGLWMD